MSIDWAVAIPCFLTALVEWVEAFTIVLAVSLSIGWRAAIGAALAAMAALVALTFATGGVLQLGHALPWLQYGIGVMLMLFGVRWLAKAVARGSGIKKLHNEDEEFAETRALLSQADRRASWLIAFKGVFLEGLEVWLVVVALSVKSQHWASGAGGAAAALLVTVAAGAVLRQPLSKVPENFIKFCVGAMLVGFGTFWCLEPFAEDAWGVGDLALIMLCAGYLLGGVLLILAFRSRFGEMVGGFVKTLIGDLQNVCVVSLILGLTAVIIVSGEFRLAWLAMPILSLGGVAWLARR